MKKGREQGYCPEPEFGKGSCLKSSGAYVFFAQPHSLASLPKNVQKFAADLS